MSLRTGVEMISLSMIFNKITGIYGILAIFTGFSLSPLQFAMYIYSLGATVLLAFLVPHIRKQSPFQCLALAWLYLIDTVVNTAFTAAFAVTWFLAVSADHVTKGIPSSAPGSGTIGDTAGFTSPKHNVSKVDVIASPATGAMAGQDAVAYGVPGSGAASALNPSLSHGVGIEESIPSIMVVVLLTLIRVYFIFVVMAYARQVLRQHVYTRSNKQLTLHTDGQADNVENPFESLDGWRGKVGRVMVSIGRSYWLGHQGDDDWAKGLDGRFRTKTASGPPGTFERERRARSGTGPPAPALSVLKL
jgi:hypothetical protein